jgi:2-methylisocitrate lyase-like PEP mutase family enzyme
MKSQMERANNFKELHTKGNPLVLYNIWDAGSAVAIQEIGSKAIATGSWAVAASHGLEDGENIKFELVLTNLKRIISKVELPVTVDIEGGYGQNLVEVQKTVSEVINAGAVGINFEDQRIGSEEMYSCEEQCARIKGIRGVADELGIPLFINARTDLFLNKNPDQHNWDVLEEAVSRANAYSEAGADGFFAPGLINPLFIKKLCETSPLPVNIMVTNATPTTQELTDLGVSRISYGPIPYLEMLKFFKVEALKVII